jgi:seryl-tRNA synthetase
MSSRNGFITCVLVALLSAGCGSEPKRPTEQLTRAQTLIEQAEKAGAQRYAAAELDAARNKLQTANKAADDGKQEQATQLAEEAALDAELAAARAASGEAKKAAEEVGRSTEQLREETVPNPGAETAPRPETATPETATPPPQPEPGTMSQR